MRRKYAVPDFDLATRDLLFLDHRSKVLLDDHIIPCPSKEIISDSNASISIAECIFCQVMSLAAASVPSACC